jgi:hypothetical protein
MGSMNTAKNIMMGGQIHQLNGLHMNQPHPQVLILENITQMMD